MLALEIVIGGIVGTTAMMWVMARIEKGFHIHADMIGAIGSLAVGSEQLGYREIGLLLNYLAGIIFAFGYAALIGLAPFASFGGIVTLATFVGLIHGMVVGLLLVISVAEHHPLAKYRTVGIGTALAHIIGHVAYGASLGAVFAAFWSPFKNAAQNSGLEGGVRQFSEVVGYAPLWIVLFGMPLAFIAAILLLWGRAAGKETDLARLLDDSGLEDSKSTPELPIQASKERVFKRAS